MATIVPSFEKQAPGLDASTWSDVLKSQIGGSSERARRDLARETSGTGLEAQDRFDTSGTRYSGWKESAFAPKDLTSFDQQTQALFGNRLGQYTSGGKQNFGYYGDVDVYNPEEAGTYLAGKGWNKAANAEDADYLKAGLDMLDYGFGSGPRQAVYKTDQEDFSTKSGVDNYLKTIGFSDQGPKLDIKHNMAELPGLLDNFFKLKNSVYGKMTPQDYIKSLGFDTEIGADLGLTAANFENLPGFNDSFLTLNDIVYGKDTAKDFLTGQGYKNIEDDFDLSYTKEGALKPYEDTLAQLFGDIWAKQTPLEYLTGAGYQNLGNAFDLVVGSPDQLEKMSPLLSGNVKLDGSYYNKQNPVDFLTSLGLQNIGGKPDLSAVDLDNLTGFSDEMVGYNGQYFNDQTVMDFLTGKGFIETTGDAPLKSVSPGIGQEYGNDLIRWGDRYFNDETVLDFLTGKGYIDTTSDAKLESMNKDILKEYGKDLVNYGDKYFNDESVLDFLTGKGYVDIGGAPNLSVNDQALLDAFGTNLSRYGDQYFNTQNEGDFLTGHGYTLGSNQAMPTEFQNIFGSNLGRADNQIYYKGDTDYSTARYGTDGLTTRDLGGGRYEILDATGKVTGTGYKTLEDTIRELSRGGDDSLAEYLGKNITEIKPAGYSRGPSTFSWADPRTEMVEARGSEGEILYDPETGQPRMVPNPTTYRTRPEAEAAASAYYNDPMKFRQAHYKTPGAMSDIQLWDRLGDLLQGQTPTLLTGNSDWRNLGGDSETEKIKGLQTLYGSKVITLPNGKVVGYNMDVTPGETGDWGYKNPYQLAVEDLGGSSTSGSYMGRLMQNPDLWRDLTTGLGDGNAYVSAENAAKLPGWDQYSSYFRQKPDNGVFGQNGLGKVLTPIAQLASFFPATAPYAQAYLAASSLKHNDPLGAALNAYGSYTGFNPGSGIAAPEFMSGLSPAIQNGLKTAAMGGLTTAFKGGDLNDVLKSAATSGIGGYAGGELSKLFGSTMSDMTAPTQSADFVGPQETTSALSRALSSGAGSFGKSLGEGAVRSLASGNSNFSDVIKSAALSGLGNASTAGIGSTLQSLDMSPKMADSIARTATSLGMNTYQQRQEEERRRKYLASRQKQIQQQPPRKV